MEKDAPFDLSAAIQRWRDGLAHAPGFRADDLEELECHLQDSIRELQTRGLTAEEAFMIAERRIGSAAALSGEFSRLNGTSIWTDRMLWMLIGWMGIQAVSRLYSSVSRAVVLTRFANILPPFLPALIIVFPLVVAALTVRSLLQPHGRIPRTMTKLLHTPLKLSVAFFILWIVPIVLDISVFGYVAGQPVRWAIAASDLVALAIGLIFSFLILLSARRRLRLAA